MNNDPVVEIMMEKSIFFGGQIQDRSTVRYVEVVKSWQSGPALTGFWFWDETWASAFGPFENYETCRDALEEYCKTL